MQASLLITLTSDFGLDDPFAGVMKGVILSINPRANIIDLTHGIASHDIREAAFTIGMNYGFFPEHTIHVVIVDPGVGSRRRHILVVTDRYCFLGPDNGVFSYIYEKEKHEITVLDINAEHYFLRKDSSTFQGRDVFAPVAAWLSLGIDFRTFGDHITDYVIQPPQLPKSLKNGLRGEIMHIDKFGNAITNISRTDINNLVRSCKDHTPKVFLGKRAVPLKGCYAEGKGRNLYAIINSSEHLEFFVNLSRAAGTCNISIGDKVELRLVR